METNITNHESLGQLIKRLRKKQDWTLKDLIKQVTSVSKRKKQFSPSYITRIEADDDIPSPELIITLAEVLDYDIKMMLSVAKEQHKEKVLRKIDAKYDDAGEKYDQYHLKAARMRGLKGIN